MRADDCGASACSDTFSTDGLLLKDIGGLAEAGVTRVDVDPGSETSATVCNVESTVSIPFDPPVAGVSPETVVALESKTFCASVGWLKAPDNEADLGE